MMAGMRKLLLLGLVGCWGSSTQKPASPPPQPPPPAPVSGASTGGDTYGGDAYGGEDYGGGAYGVLSNSGGGPAAGNPVVPAPVVTVQPPTVGTEAIPREVIRRLIKRESSKILRCYEQELAANPLLTGTVTVRFTVSGAGNVTQASGSGLLPSVDACVARVIAAIQFPAPKGGGMVTVNYPFIFRPPGP